MYSRWIKIFLLLVLSLVYVRGLFIPIMNNNAGHHANIALHMYLTGDYVNLIDRGMDYLDKPHLLFWLAAISYEVFGVSAFSYKFFSFVFVIGGVYATYRLAKMLYGEKIGRWAALMLSTGFAFILAANDVRMDAMVVSCIALATWQLFAYFFYRKNPALLFAALALALGFATKGMIAIVLPLIAVFFYFVEQKKLRQMVTWRWLLLALLTCILLLPVFYCYYLQFDLHPEKIVRGRTGNSGVWFLLLGQSVQRYTGKGWGVRSSDLFYLVHTFLWAFLPWSVLAFGALLYNVVVFFRVKFDAVKTPAFAFTATVFLVFLLVSFSRFKNAHYINILFPYFSILTAQFLAALQPKNERKVFWLQFSLCLLLMLFIVWLNAMFFPVTNVLVGIGALLLLSTFFYFAFAAKGISVLGKTVWMSAASIIFGFFLFNFNFYPKVLPYQSGPELARQIREKNLDVSKLFYLDTKERNYTMDFYLHTLPRTIYSDSLKHLKEPIYLYAGQHDVDTLMKQRVLFDTIITVHHYNVSTLKMRFLRPSTRHEALTPNYILQVFGNR